MEQQLDKALASLEATVGQTTPENAYNMLPDTFRAEISAAEANLENARHNLAAVSGQYTEVWDNSAPCYSSGSVLFFLRLLNVA